MKLQTKNKIKIWIGYWLFFFIFEILGIIKTFKELELLSDEGYGGPALAIALVYGPGIYYFVFITVVTICVAFNKKINKIYKNTFYFFPLITLIASPFVFAIIGRIFITIATLLGY